MKVTGKLLTICLAAWLATVPPSARAEVPTGHDRLVDTMNQYIDAMVVYRDVARLPLAKDVIWTENGVRREAGSGVWNSIGAVGYRLIFADAKTGQVGLYGTAYEGDGGERAIFYARLRVANGQITEAEIVYAKRGEASLFEPESTETPDPLYNEIVPPEQRTSRAEMIAAADAYYEGIERADGSIVPAAPGCYRVENGVDTHKVPRLQMLGHCNAGLHLFGWINPVRDRRYPIVDEERGLVWALVVMEIKGGPYTEMVDGQPVERMREGRAILVAELFKIVNGRTRRMEVVMRNMPYGAPSGWPADD